MAGAVVGGGAVRPRWGAPGISRTAAAPPRAIEVASVPEPVAIASFATPAASGPQRNVFAYRSMEDRRSRLSASPPEGQARVPVLHEETPPAARPPDPPPAY